MNSRRAVTASRGAKSSVLLANVSALVGAQTPVILDHNIQTHCSVAAAMVNRAPGTFTTLTPFTPRLPLALPPNFQGTFDDAAALLCQESDVLSAHVQSSVAQLEKFTLGPEDETGDVACTIPFGAMEKADPSGANLTRSVVPGEYVVNKDACDRIAEDLAADKGWKCARYFQDSGGDTYSITQVPLVMLSKVLTMKDFFKARFASCQGAVMNAIEKLLNARDKLDFPLDRSRGAGQKSLTEKDIQAISASESTIASVYRGFISSIRRAFQLSGIRSAEKTSVFPAEGPVKPQIARLAAMRPYNDLCPRLGSTLCRPAEPLYGVDGHIASSTPWTQLTGLTGWGINAPIKGIMVRRNATRFAEYCQHLTSKILNLSGWICGKLPKVNRFILERVPQGLEMFVDPNVWLKDYGSCLQTKKAAAAPFLLEGVQEEHWVNAEGKPIDEPAPNSEKESFLACYTKQPQQTAFYEAVADASTAIHSRVDELDGWSGYSSRRIG